MNVFKKAASTRPAECPIPFSDKRSEVSDSSSSRKGKMSRFKLKMRMMSTLGMAGMVAGSKSNSVTYENTYKTDPEDNTRFSQRKAEQIIYSVLDSYLAQRDYDPKRFPMLSKTLSELIKERIKATGLERYKLVAMVTICENKNQGTRVASRCLWNQKFDDHASVVYEGPTYFAVGSVYAVYFE